MGILEILDSIRTSIETNPSFYSKKAEEILTVALSEIPEDQRHRIIKEVQGQLVPFVKNSPVKLNRRKKKPETKRKRLSKVKSYQEPPKKKERVYKTLYYPVKKWVEYYTDHSQAPNHKEETIRMNKIISYIEEIISGKYAKLSGKHFGIFAYTFEDFQFSVDNYRKAALDWSYKPRVKQHLLTDGGRLLPLDVFIFNFRSHYNPSLFLQYLENPAELKHQSEFTEVVEKLKQYYKEYLGVVKVEFIDKDLDKFNIAATKLKEFKKDNGIQMSDGQLVEHFMKALNNKYNDVYVGHLSSHSTFNTVLPNYLKKLNIQTAKTREVQRQRREAFFGSRK